MHVIGQQNKLISKLCSYIQTFDEYITAEPGTVFFILYTVCDYD